MVQKIEHNHVLLAIVIPFDHEEEGTNFYTEKDSSLQLGYISRPKGFIITPHIHNRVIRTVEFTQEVLVCKFGCVRVEFYDDKRNKVSSHHIRSGDIILFTAQGGHGFVFEEDSSLIEIKQGPYLNDLTDKYKFV